MELPILYHKGRSGAMFSWRVWTEDHKIHTEYGQVDGKKQHAIQKAIGKNIGKSNATTDAQQADKEAQSLWNFKINRKYSETPDDADDIVYLPMLAHKFETKVKKVVWPVDVQPKLDGVRCMAFWDEDNNTWILMSRSGQEYHVQHIVDQLNILMEVHQQGLVLDGELYLHGESLQNINRLVKKPRPESINIEFHVYDVIDIDEAPQKWTIRRGNFEIIFERDYPEVTNIIKHTTFYDIKTEAEVYKLQMKFVGEGYEGAIVRTHDHTYNWGHRSPGLLKVKTFQDAEFEIVSYRDGKGKFEGACIWICKTPEGRTFECTQKGTMEMRRSLFKEADQHIGSMLKVQYQTLTDDLIPQFPVGLAIRLEEDM